MGIVEFVGERFGLGHTQKIEVPETTISFPLAEQDAHRQQDYLEFLRRDWPEDQPLITEIEDIGGKIGMVGRTINGGVILNSVQLHHLHDYERASGKAITPAERVGGFYKLQ